jgi:hypothetical protein
MAENGISRRKFIAGTGAIGAAAWAAPAVLTLDRAVAVGSGPPPQCQELIQNGGFENGDFTGWTVFNQLGGTGNWFVYSGTAAPVTGFPVPAPHSGSFAALTDQQGPGSHILYQIVSLPATGTSTLTYALFWQNQAAGWSTPDTLDYTVVPNQQYRVDIVTASGILANPQTVAPADILLESAHATVGDPDFSGGATGLPANWVSVGPIDLTPFAGQMVAVRFAEVDNQFNFNLGVDDVSIQACP